MSFQALELQENLWEAADGNCHVSNMPDLHELYEVPTHRDRSCGEAILTPHTNPGGPDGCSNALCD